MSYEDILFERAAGIAALTINRPDNGNMMRHQTLTEMADALRKLRDDPNVRSGVITGFGDKFFCIGGEHDPFDRLDHSFVLPIVEVYELIDSIPKPIIAAVNGFAVGGGNVLHLVCDLTVASDSDQAVFRQVGPLVGSFDRGDRDLVSGGGDRPQACEGDVVPQPQVQRRAGLGDGPDQRGCAACEAGERVREIGEELKMRKPQALAGLKAAFSARHAGVAGQARLAHLLLTHYLRTDEAGELSASFAEKRPPDQTRFNH